jgi:hypothetical protein
VILLKKKILFLELGCLALFAFTSCKRNINDDISVEVKHKQIINCADKYYTLEHNSMDLYYIDGKTLPYVSVESFVESMTGLLDGEYHFKKDLLDNGYTLSHKYNDIISLKAVFDTQEDYVAITHPEVFEFTKQIESKNFSANIDGTSENLNEGKKQLFYNFKPYFDTYSFNNQCLVPLVVMNNLMMSPNQFILIENGANIYGFYGDVDDSNANKMRKEASKTKITASEREDNLNFIYWLLDNKYGLKEFNNIKSYKDVISKSIKDKILSLDPETYTEGYFDLMAYLNDPHSSVNQTSIYQDTDTSRFSQSERIDNMVSALRQIMASHVTDYAKDYYTRYGKAPDYNHITTKNIADYLNQNPVRIYDETAIINFTQFIIGDGEKIYNNFDMDKNYNEMTFKADSYKYDTFARMYYAMNQIKEYNKNNSVKVKNIVIDLSINGGGHIAAAWKLLGFMIPNVTWNMYDAFTGVFSRYNLKIDVDNDGNFSDTGEKVDGFNYSILASAYSYSASNSVCYVASQNNIPIIGMDSGGGMCAVEYTSLPDGTFIQISSNNTMAGAKTNLDGNLEAVNIDNGVSASKYIYDYKDYADISYINNLLKM